MSKDKGSFWRNMTANQVRELRRFDPSLPKKEVLRQARNCIAYWQNNGEHPYISLSRFMREQSKRSQQ